MPVIACHCQGPNELNPHLQDQRHRRPKQSGRPCSTVPLNGCARTQRIRQLLMPKGNITFPIILFVLVFLSCISQPYALKRNNKHSHAMKSRSWSTGSNIERRRADLSVNETLNIRSPRSQGIVPPPNGFGSFSCEMVVFDWGSLRGLTQNEHNASTNLSLMIIFSNCRSFWTRKGFHGAMSITWTRRDVSTVVEGECSLSNFSYPVHDGHITNCAAGISSSQQSSNVCVLMGQRFLLDSYFLGRNFTRIGLTIFLKECGKLYTSDFLRVD